jgi:hypothetical protein
VLVISHMLRSRTSTFSGFGLPADLLSRAPAQLKCAAEINVTPSFTLHNSN